MSAGRRGDECWPGRGEGTRDRRSHGALGHSQADQTPQLMPMLLPNCYPILDIGPGLGHGQGPEEGRMDSHSHLGQPSTPIQSPKETSPAHFMEELPQLARAIYNLAQLEV